MANNKEPTPRQEELDSIVKNEYMLTTVDNPYNPFSQWKEWNAYDIKLGYNTCAYIARIATSSDELSEADQALAINQAMDEIVSFNLSGKHIKVTKENFKSRVQVSKGLGLLK